MRLLESQIAEMEAKVEEVRREEERVSEETCRGELLELIP